MAFPITRGMKGGSALPMSAFGGSFGGAFGGALLSGGKKRKSRRGRMRGGSNLFNDNPLTIGIKELTTWVLPEKLHVNMHGGVNRRIKKRSMRTRRHRTKSYSAGGRKKSHKRRH